MRPDSLMAIEFIYRSKTAPTVKAFNKYFEPNGEALLQTILVSHVDEVKGKLVLNEAGVSISKREFGE
jgi:hypothetical protein